MMLGWSTLESWRSSTYMGRICWYQFRCFKWKMRMTKSTSLMRQEMQISILLTLNASCSLSLWKILTATSWPLQKPRMTTPKEPLPRNWCIKRNGLVYQKLSITYKDIHCCVSQYENVYLSFFDFLKGYLFYKLCWKRWSSTISPHSTYSSTDVKNLATLSHGAYSCFLSESWILFH